MKGQLLKMFDLLSINERPILERAILVSTLAHSRQVDKGKKPYILHPLTVGLNPLLQSDEEKSVGFLHDVVEDTDLTISDLEQYFPKEVTEALKILTHEDGVDYFDYIDTIFCQSQEDKTRLEALGAKNIQVFGNLKLAEIPRITNTYLPPQKPLWVIASTHSKNGISEEVLILQEILKAYPTDYNTQIFLFAPRHPERFLEVESLLNAILTQNNLPTITKTSTNGIPHSLQSSFVLLDALGELNNLYNIAYGVILGGSFLPDIGGHNPIEPAFFHTKLISGPYIFNQNALFACVENYVLSDIKNLAQTLQTPLKNSLITQHLDITQLIKESQ